MLTKYEIVKIALLRALTHPDAPELRGLNLPGVRSVLEAELAELIAKGEGDTEALAEQDGLIDQVFSPILSGIVISYLEQDGILDDPERPMGL